MINPVCRDNVIVSYIVNLPIVGSNEPTKMGSWVQK